ncbi:DUF2505 domain-containing protein [Prescottella subtropica]|uniref:DUF2505 domain-containing protein n=1 Tax=Prescottella subtropica TaxID=2545757 RepID=UPI0010F806D2|nr:DUF2505 domain-containing protein [Prescottella subtropica]
MARRIDYSATFEHPAETVYAALGDRGYWEARMAQMRTFADNAGSLVSHEVTADGIDLVIHHVLPRTELPEIAQAVLKSDLIITRTERYTRFGDPVTGTYEATIPAAPGSLTGTMELFGTGTGCTLRTTSEAKVSIPFVGGKIEELMLANLVELFRNEAAITTAWLAAR